MTGLRRFSGRDGEAGQALIMVAIVFMALLFVVGLAIDGGQLFAAKRTMQEAADSAAFGGGVVLYQNGTAVQAIAAAKADATKNGFTDGVNSTTVTVNSPPTSGSRSGNALYVEVVIVRQVKTSLVPAEAAFNPVRARGVGGAAPVTSPFAMVLMKATGPCLTMTSGGNIVVPNGANLGGEIQANCSGTSITTSGGTITDALGVLTVGTVNNPSKITGPLTQNTAAVADPFAGFPRPAIGTVVSNSHYNVPGSACSGGLGSIGQPLPAGTYVGGITNNNSCNVYLATGVFIMKGGGFYQAASGGNITTSAGGVLLFNTHDNYPGAKGGGTCGGLVADAGGGFNLTGMTTGQYLGMAYYQDIACTNSIDVQSNGSYLIHGTLYAPGAKITMQSSGAMTIDAQLVVSEISFDSSSTLTINYHLDTAAQSGLPELVE